MNYKKKSLFLLCVALFLVSFGTRFLIWQDKRIEVLQLQTVVTQLYQMKAQFIKEDGLGSLFDSSARVANLDLWGHPPGYSFLLFLIYSVYGESNVVIQFLSIFCDCLSVILIFLIAGKLLSIHTALIAGLFGAFSPQLGFNSILLLPDALAILPVLLAIYVLIFAIKLEKLWLFGLTGFLIGISCWLRANALLLAPFLAIFIFLCFRDKKFLNHIVLLTGILILMILPITIRHFVVYEKFVLLSLGAGQTLLEGIGDYDKSSKLGVPYLDVEISKQEAQMYNRPDYALTLFGEDGIERDRLRIKRGVKIIKENPLWFCGVVIRRALWMLRLENAPRVNFQIPDADNKSFTGYLVFSIRLIVHIIQRLVSAVVVLPLAAIGLILLIYRRKWLVIKMLSVIPIYYLIFQSILHTEFRYILAMHCFTFIFAAVGLVESIKFAKHRFFLREPNANSNVVS